MNPDTQQSYTGGNNFGVQPTSAGAPKEPWSPLRKTLTIIGIVVGVLIIAAVLLFVFGGGRQKSPSKKTSDATLYKSRPGYTGLNSAIGDPAALVQRSTGATIQYNGQNVIQACSVASLKDVSDAGFYVEAAPLPGSVARTFFDGKGRAPITAPDYLASDQDGNSCVYAFQSGSNDDVALDVYQPSYTSSKGVNSYIDRSYDAVGSAHGLQVLTLKTVTGGAQPLPNTSDYVIRSGDNVARIHMVSADTKAKNALLDRIETNFANAINTPTPLSNFDYDSPIFTGAVTLACNLTDNTTVKTVTGNDASPLVSERIASAVGVVDQDGKSYNYVENSCERRTTGDTYTNVPKVRVVTETFENAEGAKGAFAYAKSSPYAKGITSTPTTIGDESFFGDTADVEHAIVFRKGRVVVFTTYDLPTGKDDTITPTARMQALMPAMTQIAGNVKSY